MGVKLCRFLRFYAVWPSDSQSGHLGLRTQAQPCPSCIRDRQPPARRPRNRDLPCGLISAVRLESAIREMLMVIPHAAPKSRRSGRLGVGAADQASRRSREPGNADISNDEGRSSRNACTSGAKTLLRRYTRLGATARVGIAGGTNRRFPAGPRASHQSGGCGSDAHRLGRVSRPLGGRRGLGGFR